jgi:hypothetical protein
MGIFRPQDFGSRNSYDAVANNHVVRLFSHQLVPFTMRESIDKTLLLGYCMSRHQAIESVLLY